MFKVTIYSALTGDNLWAKFFHDEEKAEKYGDYFFDPEGEKGFGRCLMSTYEKVAA